MNYKLLADSIEFYEKQCFEIIEPEWRVPTKFLLEYFPCITEDKYFNAGNEELFVGSAEQSLIYAYKQGLLQPGLYQAITPCFRKGDNESEFHRELFMKNELIFIYTDRVRYSKLLHVVSAAARFFKQYVPTNKLNVVETGIDSCDILLNGIEIGSYGCRKVGDIQWIYGTGLAEPRFTMVLNKES